MLRIERITPAVLGIAAIAFLAGCDRPTAPTPSANALAASKASAAQAGPAAAAPSPDAPRSAAAPLASPRPTTPAPPAVQTPAPDGFVRVSNTHCPVQTDHAIRRGMVAQEYAVEHRGRMIGMCCGDCVDYWKNLSDEERDELVAKVIPAAPK